MSRTLKLLILLATIAPVGVFLACSSSSGGGAGGDGGGGGHCDIGGADGGTCVPGTTPAYTSCVTNLMTPTVSFAKDIQPIFNSSCGIAGSTCHGNPNNDGKANGQVFLGIVDGGVDAAQVLGVIVGQSSPEDPSLDIVTAGDPAKSYLMHKLDYDQCQFAAQCNATGNQVFTNCGLGMPFSSGTLSVAERDDIRRWIAQGAQNN